MIKVKYESLPIIASAADAMKSGAPLLHGEDLIAPGPDGKPQVVHKASLDNVVMVFSYGQGTSPRARRNSNAIVEDVFQLHYVAHCYMGVSGMIAEFRRQREFDALLQTPKFRSCHKREFADLLGMDAGRIRIIQLPIGGGFGSKLDIYPFEPIAIFLAKVTKRQVKLVFSREEEFIASPTRQPVLLKLRSACTTESDLARRGKDQRLPAQALRIPRQMDRRRPDQTRYRHALDAARRRRRQEIYSSDGCGTILKVDDFAHVTLLTGGFQKSAKARRPFSPS